MSFGRYIAKSHDKAIQVYNIPQAIPNADAGGRNLTCSPELSPTLQPITNGVEIITDIIIKITIEYKINNVFTFIFFYL